MLFVSEVESQLSMFNWQKKMFSFCYRSILLRLIFHAIYIYFFKHLFTSTIICSLIQYFIIGNIKHYFNYFKQQHDRNQWKYKINQLCVGNKECKERNFSVPATPCFSNLQYCMFWQNISLVCFKNIIHSEGYRADIRNKYVSDIF